MIQSGALLPGIVGVKSVQRGTITLGPGVATNTATITAVVLANCAIEFCGCTYSTDGGVAGSNTRAYVELTNTTTVTASRVSSGNTVIVSWEIREYYPGVLKSVQRGIIAMSGVASNTATITAVEVAKSSCSYLGEITDDANVGEYTARTASRVELTNTTTVTATRGNGTNANNVSYEVREYY